MRHRSIGLTHYHHFYLTAIITGIIIIFMALALTNSTGSLFTITLSLTGVVLGPHGGVFFIAFLMPWIDWLVSKC